MIFFLSQDVACFFCLLLDFGLFLDFDLFLDFNLLLDFGLFLDFGLLLEFGPLLDFGLLLGFGLLFFILVSFLVLVSFFYFGLLLAKTLGACGPSGFGLGTSRGTTFTMIPPRLFQIMSQYTP